MLKINKTVDKYCMCKVEELSEIIAKKMEESQIIKFFGE